MHVLTGSKCFNSNKFKKVKAKWTCPPFCPPFLISHWKSIEVYSAVPATNQKVGRFTVNFLCFIGVQMQVVVSSQFQMIPNRSILSQFLSQIMSQFLILSPVFWIHLNWFRIRRCIQMSNLPQESVSSGYPRRFRFGCRREWSLDRCRSQSRPSETVLQSRLWFSL